MYVIVPMCCFCHRVQDEAFSAGEHNAWMPLNAYRAKYGLLPGEIWSAHTECPDCGRQYEQFMAHHHFRSMPSLPA